MKKISIFIAIVAFFALAFTVVTNPTTIPEKLKAHHYWNYHSELNVADSTFQKKGLVKPTQFSSEIESIFRDSFLTNSPTEIFHWANQFMGVSKSYGYTSVEVGYGIVPSYEPYTPINFCRDEAKQLLGKTLFGTKLGRLALYERVVPTYLSAFVQKSDSLQALDLFLIWKTVKYCDAYNESTEVARLAKDKGKSYYDKAFTSTDWRGKEDHDAKLYAFVYRRLHDGSGLNIANCQYYSKKLLTDFESKATPTAQRLATQGQDDWIAGRLTTAPHFAIARPWYTGQHERNGKTK